MKNHQVIRKGIIVWFYVIIITYCKIGHILFTFSLLNATFRNVIFEINVSCKKNPKCPKTATDPKELYENAVVYSNAFKWVPIGDQSKDLLMQPAMVYDDILVAKLRPGQEIEAK